MPRIAILDPNNLLGQELRESLERHPRLAADVRLLATDAEEFGTLTEVAGAAAVVSKAGREHLAGLDLFFACGEMSATRPSLEARDAGTTAILLCPDATLTDGVPVVAGVNPDVARRGEVLLSPNPSTVLLAHLLHGVGGLVPLQAVATVLQPTSVYGEEGMDELLQQARDVLAMGGIQEGGRFGGQLAFNVLPGAVGGEAVAGQARQVLGSSLPLSVEILQGAVFHGMVVSLWVELEVAPDAEAVREVLLESPWIELAEHPEALGPVASAAEGKILLGGVRGDESRPGSFWIRAVMDNLTRGGALNALEVASAVLT